MSTYLIGDIHGCYDELKAILAQVHFDPVIDTLWLTGDLVARGPSSLEVLRLIYGLDDSVRMVLGNHDLNLLAVYSGVNHINPKDRITSLLEASDADELINWLRHKPLLQIDEEKQLMMTHAGISPQWDTETASQCANEVETILASDNYYLVLKAMFISGSTNWKPELTEIERLGFSINVFTRMRYCFPNGHLEMSYKDTPEKAPAPLCPWFNLLVPASRYYKIVFGHWASLMGHNTPVGIYGIDTGCCWGGELTLLCWEDKQFIHQPSLSQPNYLNY